MRYYVLHNPKSNNGRGSADIDLLSIFYEDITYRNVCEIPDIPAFMAPMTADDAVIICGGDGTLNRFVNAMNGNRPACRLYYYATGSGNDFLRDVGGNADGSPICIDRYLEDLPTVTVDGQRHLFLNGIGYGIDGYCCEVGDRLRERGEKTINYTAIAIKDLLFHYKPTAATVTVDGKEYRYERVWLAPTMKGRYYGGGMMPAPQQDRLAGDKRVTLTVIHSGGKLRILTMFPSLFKGEHLRYRHLVSSHTGHRITVRFDRPTPLQIDGETVKDVREYTVEG